MLAVLMQLLMGHLAERPGRCTFLVVSWGNIGAFDWYRGDQRWFWACVVFAQLVVGVQFYFARDLLT